MSIHFWRRACAFDDPFRIDFKSCEEELFDLFGDSFDFSDRSIEVFEIVEHLLIPRSELFKFVDEIGIGDGELS